MTEEYAFPPYEEEVSKALEKFGAEKMKTYKGRDVTPMWDFKGGHIVRAFKYLYSAPRLEKIVFGAQSFSDKLMSYATIIWRIPTKSP